MASYEQESIENKEEMGSLGLARLPISLICQEHFKHSPAGGE